MMVVKEAFVCKLMLSVKHGSISNCMIRLKSNCRYNHTENVFVLVINETMGQTTSTSSL